MKRLAHAKKRDANEPEIVEYLRKEGAKVELLDKPVDLLIGYRNQNILAEVKTPEGMLQKGQIEFIARWSGDSVRIFRSIDDAQVMIDEINADINRIEDIVNGYRY